jgi:predicted ATPase with chaperone activity
MLARRLTTILPALTLAEAIETTRIPHAAGRTGDSTPLIKAQCLRGRRGSGGAHTWRRRGAQPNHSGWCAVASKRSLVLKRS